MSRYTTFPVHLSKGTPDVVPTDVVAPSECRVLRRKPQVTNRRFAPKLRSFWPSSVVWRGCDRTLHCSRRYAGRRVPGARRSVFQLVRRGRTVLAPPRVLRPRALVSLFVEKVVNFARGFGTDP